MAKAKTLAEEGTPFAALYFGGRFTGRLVTEEEAMRDLTHHYPVGEMTESEFFALCEEQILAEYGDD